MGKIQSEALGYFNAFRCRVALHKRDDPPRISSNLLGSLPYKTSTPVFPGFVPCKSCALFLFSLLQRINTRHKEISVLFKALITVAQSDSCPASGSSLFVPNSI